MRIPAILQGEARTRFLQGIAERYRWRGQCRSWVKLRRTQCEYMFSASPSNSALLDAVNMSQTGPTVDPCTAAGIIEIVNWIASARILPCISHAT